jgi:hypothetical protein
MALIPYRSPHPKRIRRPARRAPHGRTRTLMSEMTLAVMSKLDTWDMERINYLISHHILPVRGDQIELSPQSGFRTGLTQLWAFSWLQEPLKKSDVFWMLGRYIYRPGNRVPVYLPQHSGFCMEQSGRWI